MNSTVVLWLQLVAKIHSWSVTIAEPDALSPNGIPRSPFILTSNLDARRPKHGADPSGSHIISLRSERGALEGCHRSLMPILVGGPIQNGPPRPPGRRMPPASVLISEVAAQVSSKSVGPI